MDVTEVFRACFYSIWRPLHLHYTPNLILSNWDTRPLDKSENIAFTKLFEFSREDVMTKYVFPARPRLESAYSVRGAPLFTSVQHRAFISFSALASLWAAANSLASLVDKSIFIFKSGIVWGVISVAFCRLDWSSYYFSSILIDFMFYLINLSINRL